MTIVPAPNDEIIQSEDILVFFGNPEGLMQMSDILGLKLISQEQRRNRANIHTILYEVGISSNSPLLNKKIKESHFRSRYNAAIVAVKRKSIQITSGRGNALLSQETLFYYLQKMILINHGQLQKSSI